MAGDERHGPGDRAVLDECLHAFWDFFEFGFVQPETVGNGTGRGSVRECASKENEDGVLSRLGFHGGGL